MSVESGARRAAASPAVDGSPAGPAKGSPVPETPGHGAAARSVAPFSIDRRVYYQHTDAGGVVFHANYLAFMEQARTDYLLSLGFDVARLASEQEVLFIVHRASLAFLRPARLNDAIRITAEPVRVGRARVIFRQIVSRAAGEAADAPETLVEGEVQLACVHPASFRPVPLPAVLRAKLGYEEND